MTLKPKSKKGAMEMSVGTIVTIVLLVTVLVLGLVLVRTIFTGAKYNVDVIDEKVRGEINTLFAEDDALVVHLPNRKAEIDQGDEWGVAWGIKNLRTGPTQQYDLTYEVVASETANCGISNQEATSYIILGQKEESGIPLPQGSSHYEISRIQIPENAPLCSIRYRIDTQLNDADYESTFFDVVIRA